MSVSVFLPTRKGSERVPLKNTRTFAGIEGGLLRLKLQELMKLEIDEIILSTNDEESIAIAQEYFKDSRLRIDKRPDHLASSKTSLIDLIKYVPTITDSEHILWTHVTSPFANSKIYREGLKNYFNALDDGFDSLMSVTAFQNFLWAKEKNDIINRLGNERWPKTQDLELLFEINSAIFISPREVYENKSDRVGSKPFLFEMSKLSSLDVDWEEDFKIAEAVYEKIDR